MSAIKGYSSDSKKSAIDGDSIQNYVTQQKAGTGKVGMDMLPKALYDVQLGVSLVPEVGSTEDLIVLTAHGFKEGDVVRFDAGVNIGAEATVINVIDANSFELGHKFSTAIVPADTFKQLRYLTLTIDSSGGLVTTAGPIQILKGDSGVFTSQVITKDDTDSNNTIPMPVEIVSFDGTEINITAGDINVQTSHTGANPDSMRIGDGVTEWGIEVVTKKGLVKDALVETAVNNVSAQLPATIGIQADAASLSVTQSTEDRAATVLRDANIALIETATTASAASLSNIEAQLPATLGSKADAASLAVTQSTEDKATQNDIKAAVEALVGASEDTTENYYKRDFGSSPLATASSWVTLRLLTASIKRISVTNNSGNELLIRNQTTDKHLVVGAGASVNTSLVGVATDVIEIQALAADATSGIIYLNFEG